ncbi:MULTISPECIES: MBL fold metallo-hydrolase [unclassified Streptomyces]|uniref:MBL fold metallo-hydrolase n=1 Tax=Streptomyces TaxID=1883 RepID=UPI001368CAD9|nr:MULTISPECIES: MBL fold metallo-hydrolase [unclassified Streptomyces]NEA01316.1 MBL fold metallo-hydrolase [Streptomyces sp. SID10116]MYY83949.1 MBL fold metallo-hydrolase [Streptomyces sp. SID335]MYZ12127.1 MBL fold metallo-hydrolase [Streptomyces sp. SID337]NDZ84151.1 MBL fold metallo-hydrolase [Streptomyces sp. SID10115]NEB44640.1 MBL fold metallo-hydrolase [Streptomyces sp. SID339]
MILPTQLTAVPGTDSLHVWNPEGTGRWGYANCLWIISGPDAALIDTPYDVPMTQAMIAAAEPLLGDRTVRTVVNTHANGDHTFGNHLFPGAEIIATRAGHEHLHHEPTPQQMHALVHQTPADVPLGRYVREHFSGFDFSSARLTPPTWTFSGQHTFTVGDTEVELHEVGPAHHVGDLVARIGDVVCTGDVFFHGDHPSHWAGPLQNVIDACEFVLGFNPRVVVPGHGRPTDRAGLEAHLVYLRAVQREVRLRYEGGLSVEKAMEDLARPEFYPDLGLPERLMILIAMEYSHLDGRATAPTVLELAGRAAAWSYR